MSGILGDLCSGEKDLKRTAFKRRKVYNEESVHHAQVETYKRNGWTVVRENKTKTRMRKANPPDVLFEDRVWMIFYNLGFSYMNKGPKCKLQFDPYSKLVDVLARDDENIFVVECKSSESEGPYNAKDILEEYVGKQQDIQKAIEAEWGRKCGRINIVIAISSREKREADKKYVEKKRDKNVLLWSATEIEYIENLIRQVGPTAKYQLYSVIFADRRQKRLKVPCPAIKGRIGGHTFYTFLISAKQLLKYAYVHHRHLTGIIEASQVYQRMLRNAKLKEIAKFIDFEEGYFPNSIIVNFSKSLQWKKKEVFNDDVAMGTLTLPEYFGSAWIIDGQHRLYGAARADKDVLVPVLAFENIEQLEQANLFVEINVKQTSVEKKLLWDLYSDIYRDSMDEKQKKQYQVAETAKKMEASGPLMGCIDIPSIPADRPVKLSLTTICSTIEKYSPWDDLKDPTDETKTPENAARIINSYFEVLKSLWPEEWTKGNKGVLLTNNGFGVFMMVLKDIVRNLVNKDQKSLLRSTKTNEFKKEIETKYLLPVIEYLKMDTELQEKIRTQTGRGPQRFNAGYLECAIQRLDPTFWSPLISKSPPTPLTKEPPSIPSIEEKIRLAEPVLRNFVLEKLNQIHGDKWWRQGVPGGPKKDADDKWMAEISRKKYLHREKNQNQWKFESLGLGHMVDIIIYGENWERIFEQWFGNKDELKRRIKDIMALRNPSVHRKPDDQDVVDGEGGLLWLSKCIGERDLNPYA